jgi:hypothetical protein
MQMSIKKQIILFLFFIPALINAQETKMRGFVNVNYGWQEQGKSNFAVGQYDNFITSNITDRISFLGETVFEFDEGFILDIERVILKYEVDNRFEIKCGKFHNPLGYWNNAYHHGTLLQPTIQRPDAVRFEDEGGILQIHSTGLWLSGHDIGKIKFGYDVAISNGIGSNYYVADDNNSKGITVGMHVKPADKLEIGISGYSDRLYQNETNIVGDSLPSAMSIAQAAFHIAYLGSKIEFIAENHYILHSYGLPIKKNSTTNALFGYFGFRLNNKFTPYVLYDNLSFDTNDLYFTGVSNQKFTLGFRYAFSYLANLKLEFTRHEIMKVGNSHSATLSFAIGF